MRLNALTSDQRIAASHGAREILERQSEWQRATAIFFYAPLPEELDVWPLLQDSIAARKTICLPRFDPETQCYVPCVVNDLSSDIVTGRFGVREPAPHCATTSLNRLDLILLPGVAFDTRGHRLGRGKGYYDRLLAEAGGIRCGVAFDEQILTEIPIEPHDARVNCIVTPTRWIEP